MNYYIEGSPTRAEQIKAAFEKLGCDTTGWTFNVEGGFYYTHGGRIDLACGKFLINFIKTHPEYQELELPVEPKFKVGDWVIRNDGSSIVPIQVYGLKKDRYLVTNMLGSKGQVMINRQDEWRLWTIQDAKDGDVLYTYECSEPKIVFILRGGPEGNFSVLSYHCYYNIMYPYFEPDAERGCLAPKREDVKPATKEQRDLLFQKMKEAGYEWDAGKKELKKIQPHYDIKNFKPFDKVLIRFGNNDTWRADFFSHIKEDRGRYFVGIGYANRQCIPFNDYTKHLLGTTDMPDEMYINW